MRTSFSCPWSITSVRLVHVYWRIRAAFASRASVTWSATSVGDDWEVRAAIAGGEPSTVTTSVRTRSVFITAGSSRDLFPTGLGTDRLDLGLSHVGRW